jgi:hypothetical protein
MLGSNPLGLLPRRLRSRIEGLRRPIRLGALLPFDSGENAINPNAGILKISKQMSGRYPFTISADQTEIQFTLNQNMAYVDEYPKIDEAPPYSHPNQPL